MKDFSWRAFRDSDTLLLQLLLLSMLLVGAALYVAVCNTLRPETPTSVYLIRASAFLATFLLQLMACARPLGALHPWLGAIHRNRSQLAVLTLLVALVHASLVTYRDHVGGNLPALLSLADYSTGAFKNVLSGRASIHDLPFEAFGTISLLALMLLALASIGVFRGRIGSAISTCVEPVLYPAYGAMLVHVGLGIVQAEGHLVYFILLGVGLALFFGLHLSAVLFRSSRSDERRAAGTKDGDEMVDSPDSLLHTIFSSTRIYLLLTCPIYMALLAAAQPEVRRGHYEQGKHNVLEGVYYASPAPMLFVTPEWSSTAADAQPILLCGPGKLGLPSEWSKADGRRVRLRGQLLYRDTISMLEVDGAPEILGDPAESQRRADPGPGEPVSVSGELVDMKCYLGYMWPADGVLHRACTIRCLSGGIAPGIILGADRSTTVFLLTGPKGTSLDFDKALGGSIVQVNGTLFRLNGFSYICADTVMRREAE